MTKEFEQEDIHSILLASKGLILENTDYLCELDSVVGDGDHGTTMARGLKAACLKIEADGAESITALLADYSMEMIKSMGGAAGPLFGSLFKGMSVGAKNCDKVSAETLENMFAKGLEKVKKLGKAEPGEKTFVDSLEPAVDQMKKSRAQGKDIPEILNDALKAARDGSEATKDMTAAKGRARYAGERGHGHIDAGSVTVCLILQAFCQQCEKD